MQTTKQYLHLAVVIFRQDSDALERRLMGPVEGSTDLSVSETISDDVNRLDTRLRGSLG